MKNSHENTKDASRRQGAKNRCSHENAKTRNLEEKKMLRMPSPFTAEFERLVHQTIGCCVEVHRGLGPGLLEAVYQRAAGIELESAGIPFEREKPCPILYRGKTIYVHRLDLVVAGQVLLELKAVDRVHPVHRSQVLSCLRASKLRLGLLINFNVAVLPQGTHRIVL